MQLRKTYIFNLKFNTEGSMMNKLQKKLDFLLQKHAIEKNIVLKERNTVSIDGIELPLFSHRYERRLVELKKIVCDGTLFGISVMRTARIVESGSNIFDELRRELDICQYVLDRKIKTVTAMQNDNVLNVIATTDDKIVCTIEISATLSAGEAPKDKHEIISQRGIACDIVVDAQLKQDSIYVFGTENKQYTDVDFEIFGLSVADTAIVRSAFALAQTDDYSCVKENAQNLEKLVELAKKSAETNERMAL